MIFNPGALDELPVTLLNSFYLDPAQKKKLVGLVREFPSITLLEMDALLNQVTAIIGQVTLAVETILGFVLLAGLMVTLAAIHSTMNERLREGALLRTLGAGRSTLNRNQWSDFAGMGAISGLVGVLGAELVNALLYHRVFELDYAPAWWAWIMIPLASALLIGMAGVLNSRRVLQRSPIESLRRG
jgi:putative ABC transport system permease protein